MPRALVLLAALCFGTTGTAQALGPEGVSPAAVGAARVAVGGALLLAVALLGARHPSPRLPRGPVALAAAAIALYQVTFFAAVSDTGVAVGTIVALGSAPALAGLLERVVLRRPLPAYWAAATGLACAGVVLLTLRGAGAGAVSLSGIALAGGAGAAYATYTLSSKHLLDAGHAPERVMGAAFALAGVALLPVLLVAGGGWLGRADGLALALYLGVVPTALAYLLFARGLRRLAAAETATLTLAEPLTAALLAALVLGERLGPSRVAGATLILAGLLLLGLKGQRAAADPRLRAARQGATL
jgi:DME family drug/metabolite transporter